MARTRVMEEGERLESLKSNFKRTHSRISDLETIGRESESTTKCIEDLIKRIQDLRVNRDSKLQNRTTLQTRFDHCEVIESNLKAEKTRLKKAKKDVLIYRELVEAFGKDGIQALIIEQSIPEIEEEANQILARLSDNRTQITLESLRDLKKGGTRETLDIKISDELGERSYELYSGGEAFRVDFAVRIALSKLLASRTGTKLQTLVIDEGFGTQDTEGLESLVEAIQAISEDFEKILVITHVESLKQAFPVRIEVTKYPDTGSQFEVLY